MKYTRVHDGYLWEWETIKGFIRVVRKTQLSGDIDNYAERLVDLIQSEEYYEIK